MLIHCGFADDALPQDAIAALRGGTRDDVLSFAGVAWSNLQAADDPAMRDAEIIFGQPGADVSRLVAARWIQLTSAGYARYDNEATRRALASASIAVTNSSSVYADPCAEQLLAMMLSHARRLPQSLDMQRGERRWPSASERSRMQVLRGQRVVLLGYGAIGRRLHELLSPFEMDVTVVRRATSDEAIDAAVSSARHVVSTLPGSAGCVFDARRIALLSDEAFVYNIGRGSTLDQSALSARLAAGLAGAYLDVTEPEPLPPDHPLWLAPRCTITPHTAGGRREEQRALVEHFLANLARFKAGEPLLDRVLDDTA